MRRCAWCPQIVSLTVRRCRLHEAAQAGIAGCCRLCRFANAPAADAARLATDDGNVDSDALGAPIFPISVEVGF